MDFNILYIGGCAVKVISQRSLADKEVRNLFREFGEIRQITRHEDFQIVYFCTVEDAVKCVQQFRRLSKPRITDLDPDSTGDTGVRIKKQESLSIKKLKERFITTPKKTNESHEFNTGSSKNLAQHSAKDVDHFIPNCSSPVLLNTMDPGFRLAYCHNVQCLKPNDTKPRRLKQFNESIKKYMDSTPKLGSQELILTNLPSDFQIEDVYRLCGEIEPETIEIKKTSHSNIVYANVRVKTKDDLEKLNQMLGNRQINGTKITAIPITKISNTFPAIFPIQK